MNESNFSIGRIEARGGHSGQIPLIILWVRSGSGQAVTLFKFYIIGRAGSISWGCTRGDGCPVFFIRLSHSRLLYIVFGSKTTSFPLTEGFIK